MLNVSLTIYGKVQGVFFRKETQRMAKLLGVNGWVKNNDDGSVSVSAEAEAERIYKLIDYCHHGPENAVVEKVSVYQGEIMGYTDFEIH